MIPFGESFVAIASALLFPALVGLGAFIALGRRAPPRYLAAFALGIFFWFFSDTVGGSSYLDVNSGFDGGWTQAALLVLFALGALTVFSLDRGVLGPPADDSKAGLGVPLLVALALGVHGFGEGAAFSATAAATSSTNLFQAFGGVSPAVSFILHKAIEPMMIGAVYLFYSGGRSRNFSALFRDVLLLSVVFILPGLLGGATNYFMGYETTYSFALGTGTSLFAAAALAKPLFLGSGGARGEPVKLAALMLLGLLCIYFAALFHS